MAKRNQLKKKTAVKKKATTSTNPDIKKTTKRKSPARKPVARKEVIGYEIQKGLKKNIEKSFDKLQKIFDVTGQTIGKLIYENDSKSFSVIKEKLVEMSKEHKVLKGLILDTKKKTNPIYKD